MAQRTPGLGPDDGDLTAMIDAADRRLIAAAPDLLAALRYLTDVVESAVESGLFLSIDGKKPDVMALQSARLAIAKAEERGV